MTDLRLPSEETILETFGKEDLRRLLDDHQRLLILYGFANVISTILDIELLLNEVMNVVFGLVQADRGAIFLPDSKTGELVRGASRSRHTNSTRGNDGVSGNAIIDFVLREKKALLTADASSDSRFKDTEPVRIQGIRSCLCVPLTSQHQVLGVIYVDSQQPDNFLKEQLTLITGIANQTAVALENIESVQRLKEERKRVEDILKALPVAILSMNEEGRISFVNPRAEKLFCVEAKECLNRPYRSFFSGVFRPLLSFITPALQEGEKVVLEEVVCGDPDHPILLQVNIVPLKEGAIQKGVLLALDDITEKKRLEREVLNAEKLSAIGEMTAGLIHEINNPLNIISGRAQLLLMGENGAPEISKAARIIWEQVDRATSITEKLLSFARQRFPQLRPVTLKGLLEKFLETMEGEFASQKVRLVKEFSNAPLPILGDAEQLEEVFVNLARNAIQAMPNGGIFSVIAKNEEEAARVFFRDTGCGISPENLSKIFIPFFTTKSRGTGLGLSIVHGIVKNHGGTLEVQSQVGEGSTFILTIPLKKEG